MGQATDGPNTSERLLVIPVCLWSSEDVCLAPFSIAPEVRLLPVEYDEAVPLLRCVEACVNSTPARLHPRLPTNIEQCTHLLTADAVLMESYFRSSDPEDWLRPVVSYMLSHRQMSDVLAPPLERVFTSFLIAGRTIVTYAGCFAVADCGSVPKIADWMPVDGGMPYHLAGDWSDLHDAYLSKEPASCETLRLVKAIYAGLRRCKGKTRRPLTASDVFHRALNQKEWHVRFLLLVIALEALFSEGASELAHQVSERAASLLEPPGEGRIERYRKLKEVYRLRSKIVHGAQPIRPAWARDVQQFTGLLRDAEDVVREALRHVLTRPDITSIFCASSSELRRYFDVVTLGESR